MSSGQTTTVGQLTFGIGRNMHLAGQAGDIFVTNLPANVSRLQVSQIGIFGAKQSFGISFSGAEAAAQGFPRTAAHAERLQRNIVTCRIWVLPSTVRRTK